MVIPIPVSETLNYKILCEISSTLIVILPLRVNFIAFPTKFIRIYLNLRTSVYILVSNK